MKQQIAPILALIVISVAQGFTVYSLSKLSHTSDAHTAAILSLARDQDKNNRMLAQQIDRLSKREALRSPVKR